MPRPRSLTPHQARTIVDQVRGGARSVEVAAEHGVTLSLVRAIMTGRRYSDVTGILPASERKETMSGETAITVIGNLTADPELRFTPNGVAVANFTIASTPRVFDRQANDWKDGETLFLRASVWREAAENVAETLTKGTRVIALCVLEARSYETKEGERRTSMELKVEEIGPSLRYASAKVNRTQRGDGAQQGGGGGYGGGNTQQGNQGGGGQWQGQQAQQGGNNGWPAANQQAQQGGGWGAAQSSNEPPF